MSISPNDERGNLAEARFTGRGVDRSTGGSLCDCMVIDPCGCTVNACTCFVTDEDGCYQDCPCKPARSLRTIDIADRTPPAF